MPEPSLLIDAESTMSTSTTTRKPSLPHESQAGSGAATVSVSAAGGASAAARGPLLRRPFLVAPFLLGVIALAFAALPVKHAVLAAFTAAALVLLSAIDIERRVIPNRIVLPAAGVALLLQLALFPGRAPQAALAAIATAFVLMIPRFFNRAWLGMGDVKLVLLIGAALGWGVVGAVLLGFMFTLPVSLWILVRRGLKARATMIPFGPFLALGALVVLIGPYLAGFATN